MKTRGFAVMLAIVLAAAATGAVYLYVRGVKQENHASTTGIQVLVSRVDIPPGTSLDPLINSGQFELKSVPASLLVQGAATNLDQLRGHTTSSTIIAGEQVTVARLTGTTNRTGGVLGIRSGYEAITVSLDAAHGGGGYIQPGDHVTVYAEGDINVINGDFSKLLLHPVATTKTDIGDWAFTVIPDVRVLRVFNAGTASPSTSGGVQGTQQSLQITVEVTPEDAQRIVLAREQFAMWLALLPPGQTGTGQPPAGINIPAPPATKASLTRATS
jgi:Flp pilus assembly protein CpaB